MVVGKSSTMPIRRHWLILHSYKWVPFRVFHSPLYSCSMSLTQYPSLPHHTASKWMEAISIVRLYWIDQTWPYFEWLGDSASHWKTCNLWHPHVRLSAVNPRELTPMSVHMEAVGDNLRYRNRSWEWRLIIFNLFTSAKIEVLLNKLRMGIGWGRMTRTSIRSRSFINIIHWHLQLADSALQLSNASTTLHQFLHLCSDRGSFAGALP